ncbi:uncharacterized protein NPIL_583641 [Nephila pilipes]|uniref:Uncharacterized protein n=1 Tax=Nephila pilipes TaxID=299642 RepID=A0A8X6KR31_NEPPI|nr:uncharacterized protein NPIL_583641 [Nephila pilipes]
MLHHVDVDEGFLKQVCFSDRSTFHVSGQLNRDNERIWGSGTSREIERDSPKVNVRNGLKHNRSIGPFFFTENTVNGGSYLDMLQLFALPQLKDL